MARSISVLGNPILSILAIASARWEPSNVNADGSLKFELSFPGVAGAGDGVAGAFGVLLGIGAGAAGAAGVDAGAGAGVEGPIEVDAEAAGVALGCASCQTQLYRATL